MCILRTLDFAESVPPLVSVLDVSVRAHSSFGGGMPSLSTEIVVGCITIKFSLLRGQCTHTNSTRQLLHGLNLTQCCIFHGNKSFDVREKCTVFYIVVRR